MSESLKEEKKAIIVAIADALNRLEQYSEIREDALDNETDFKLSISVKVIFACDRVEASVSGNVKYQSAAYALLGDARQPEFNFDLEGGEE